MNEQNRRNWKTSTKLNHPQSVSLGPGNRPILSPIFQSAKFVVSEKVSLGSQFIYTRISNPTLKQLEIGLAEIQKKDDCIVLSSGIAAITGTILGLLKSGDHMISFREIYKPARSFIRDTLLRFGIESTLLKVTQLNSLEEAIIPGKTKLIHFESPTNPHLDIADIEKIISIARKHNILVSMDGTFGGLHQHAEFDIDVMIQSLTKFGNGHGDVIAGSIAARSDLIHEIRQMTINLGATLDPHAAFMIERGLKTYLLRYERQTKNAGMIAEFLEQHPKVEKVYYPGLARHPQGDLARKQMKDMGAMLAFTLKVDAFESAETFCYRLKLIQFAVSLGSTETLICPTLTFFGEDLSEDDKREMGMSRHSLRLSVGLEDPEDIINDLQSALEYDQSDKGKESL